VKGIYFESTTSPEALRDALVRLYHLDAARVYVMPPEGLAGYTGPDLMVLIHPPEGPGFGLELDGGKEFAMAANADEIEIARRLSTALHTRALVDDGSDYPDYWYLVARDGSYGRVCTDPDAADNGVLKVAYAFEPIAGEPDLEVNPPPEWAKDW
jgi:hypothetical protein